MPTTSAVTKVQKSSPLLGLLPYIGVILFVVTAVPIWFGDHTGDWHQQLVSNGVQYLIGWAALGAGISHLFFGPKIARSIGWAPSPFQLEVAFANIAFGVVGLLATSHTPEFWLAIILASAIYRFGCGYGHIKQIVQARNFAINNTAILFLNFVVPAALLAMYYAWI